ncbi:MAG TPA: FtsX-like permease family protein [Acidimicrobiales bacterium]|nr:FtsX-like permease family protein [Acidimicrobiales bacterium]
MGFAGGVFHLTYLAEELRRRFARTLLTAIGLAVGVGLVIGIIGVSAGLDDAQQQVLAPLDSVGTDILVTRVAGTTASSAATGTDTTATTAPTVAAAPGAGGFFGGRGRNGGLDRADADALLAENQNVVTDLASLGEPGTQFTRDFFLSATLVSFPDAAIDEIKGIDGVEQAVGGLMQLAQHQSGTVPKIVASLQTGGETVTQTVRPDPMTDVERTTFQACLASKGVTINPDDGGGPAVGGAGGGATAGGASGRTQAGPGGNPAFDECLPERFREFRATFTSPLRTIEQVVNPPSTDITNVSYTAAGVDPATPSQGLVTSEQLTAGRWLKGEDEVLLNVAYANTKSLAVGDVLPINGKDHAIVGIVRPTLTGSTADVYFPLETLQGMAGKQDRVTSVLVKATDADAVDRVAAAIRNAIPGAEVVTTAALADQVTGSLADAQGLTSRLGGVLAAIVLVAAFVIAALLTLSSVAKRVREIGTLRAIGWSKSRVVRQILGETLALGLLGGVLGVGVGVAVAALVPHVAPTLTATSSGIPGLAGSSLSGFFGQATSVAHTTTVTMRAPLSAGTLLVGVAFALVGGVVAGLLGGWRAARLSPSVALRDLG